MSSGIALRGRYVNCVNLTMPDKSALDAEATQGKVRVCITTRRGSASKKVHLTANEVTDLTTSMREVVNSDESGYAFTAVPEGSLKISAKMLFSGRRSRGPWRLTILGPRGGWNSAKRLNMRSKLEVEAVAEFLEERLSER